LVTPDRFTCQAFAEKAGESHSVPEGNNGNKTGIIELKKGKGSPNSFQIGHSWLPEQL
jgi:hypothetical protein